MSDFHPHQKAAGDAVARLIFDKGVAYLQGEPRTGKTRSVFWAINKLPVKSVVFVTKKNAIPGILSEAGVCTKRLNIINYEQVAKLDPKDFDLVVIDEAHNIGRAGKPSLRFKQLRKLAWDKPTILLSGTPWVETPSAAFYQFGVTKYTPLRFKSFYDFFREYGIPAPMMIQGRTIEQYKKVRETLQPELSQYIVRITQQQAGITAVAQDIEHHFELSPATLDLIERIKTDNIATIAGRRIAFESDMAVRTAIHQIEAGGLLVGDDLITLPNTEMMDYVRDTFGDSPDVAVMSHFRSTRAKVQACLPNVHVYSSDGHAEGVNLSHYRHFVILNTGYSGAKHIQRRDRGTLMGLTEERQVHHLMVKGQLSASVYKSVSKKLDFNLATFRAQCLKAKSKNASSTTSKQLRGAGL